MIRAVWCHRIHFGLGLLAAALIAATAVAPLSAAPATESAPPVTGLLTADKPEMRIGMPGKFDDVCLAGGGRFLVFRIPSESELAVLDLQADKLAGTIPTGDGETLFAAGQDDIVIVKPADNIIQRFDLATRKLQLTMHSEADQPLTLVSMGYASHGPVLLGLDEKTVNQQSMRSTVQFLDLETLKPLIVFVPQLNIECDLGTMVRASAEGTVFGMWRTHLSPSGMNVLFFLGSRAVQNYQHDTVGYVRPNAAGNEIFCYKGIFNVHLISKQPRTYPEGGPLPVPAVEGPLFVGVATNIPGTTGYDPARDQGPPQKRTTVTIHLKSLANPLVTLPNVAIRQGCYSDQFARETISLDKRIVYNPALNVLATLPESNDEVVLRRVDLEEELKASGKDYLAVVSSPPRFYSMGQPLSYAIKALSSRAGLYYRLKSGPPEMTVSKEGVVQWTPNGTAAGGSTSATILISDESGNTAIHQFSLQDQANVGRTMIRTFVPPSTQPPTGPQNPASPAPTIQPTPQLVQSSSSLQRFAHTLRSDNGSPGLTKADEQRQEIHGRQFRPFVGNGGPNPLLLIESTHLIVLGPDGYSLLKEITLPKPYEFIGRREGNLVGISSGQRSIDVISEATGNVTKSQSLPANSILDMALHPRKAITYVAMRDGTDVPSCHFVAFDESTGKARESKEFIASTLAIDPTGRYLYAGYDEVYRAGTRVRVTHGRKTGRPAVRPQPGRPTGPQSQISIEQAYGALDVLLKYSLADALAPEFRGFRAEIGNSNGGLHVGRGGRQIVNVAGARKTGTLRGWNTSDFDELPQSYAAGNSVTGASDFAFHPTLPIAAAIGLNRVVLFDTETGAVLNDRIDATKTPWTTADDDGMIRRLWFAPNGRSLVVVQSTNSAAYLKQLPLKLSAEELSRLGPPDRMPDNGGEYVAAKKFPLKALDGLAGGLGEEMSAADIAKQFSDSVAVVKSGDATGTAFVVGSEGYFVTCAHCIDNAEQVELHYRVVAKDGTAPAEATAKAAVMALDTTRDLALLKIEGQTPLKPVRIGLPEAIGSGEAVTLISNPGLGATVLDHTVTAGIVSSVGRKIEDQSLIQTSAAVNPGSSGGPLFNGRGQVIGVIVLKGRIEGAGFAIPTDDLTAFLLRAAVCNGGSGQIRRQWVDASGKRAVDAILLDRDDQRIKLRRADDSHEFSVPLEKISTGDQKFLKLFQANNKTIATAPDSPIKSAP
jgi:S1-C subfamily serine protease